MIEHLFEMCNFQIIDTRIAIDSFRSIPDNWAPFSVQSDVVDIHLHNIVPTQYNRDIGCATINPSEKILFSGHSILLTDQLYKHAFILPSYTEQDVETFAAYLFYAHAIRRQVLQIHSSTIEDRGRGILFLGPSGIGKTTQAERWMVYRGSTIINGDVGFVQHTSDGYFAWGSPWHGSSPYCLNARVPIKALVVLTQAPSNHLYELTGFEKVHEVSSHIMYPTWMEDCIDLCSDTLNHLLTDIPVYRLDNRADEEAVSLLASEIDRIS